MNAGARCACASSRTPAFPPHSFKATDQTTPLEIATTSMGYVTTGFFSNPLLSGGTPNKNTLTGVTMLLSGTSFGVSVVAQSGTLFGESPGGVAGERPRARHTLAAPEPRLRKRRTPPPPPHARTHARTHAATNLDTSASIPMGSPVQSIGGDMTILFRECLAGRTPVSRSASPPDPLTLVSFLHPLPPMPQPTPHTLSSTATTTACRSTWRRTLAACPGSTSTA